jgi:uncharacterized membrane protein
VATLLRNPLGITGGQTRLLTALAVTVVSFFLMPAWLLATRLLVAWNLGVLCLLTLAWVMIFRTTPDQMRKHARDEDEPPRVIFSILVVTACASLLAIIFLLASVKGMKLAAGSLSAHVALSIGAVINAWFLIHTTFTIHYANYYYHGEEDDNPGTIGGLQFPEEKEPDYLDFAYFSFVIGMTAQVSDVGISSRAIRRLVLLQGLLSFAFNTVILALTINVLAGLF